MSAKSDAVLALATDAVNELLILIPAMMDAREKDQGVNPDAPKIKSMKKVEAPTSYDEATMDTLIFCDREIKGINYEGRKLLKEKVETNDSMEMLPLFRGMLHRLNNDLNTAGKVEGFALRIEIMRREARKTLRLSQPGISLGHQCPLCGEAELRAESKEGNLQMMHTQQGMKLRRGAKEAIIWRNFSGVHCPACKTSWHPSNYKFLADQLRKKMDQKKETFTFDLNF